MRKLERYARSMKTLLLISVLFISETCLAQTTRRRLGHAIQQADSVVIVAFKATDTWPPLGYTTFILGSPDREQIARRFPIDSRSKNLLADVFLRAAPDTGTRVVRSHTFPTYYLAIWRQGKPRLVTFDLGKSQLQYSNGKRKRTFAISSSMVDTLSSFLSQSGATPPY